MSASPGFQGYQFWVWESEFMSLGNFSTEHYAVCVAQNPDSVPVSLKPAVNRPPGLFVARTAGISGWAVDRGTWNSPNLLFHPVVLSLKNIRGLFKNFYSSREEAGEHF